MHREGHVGMALLAYSPLACLTAALGYAPLTVGGAVAAGALAMVPDLDFQVPFLRTAGRPTRSGSRASSAASSARRGCLPAYPAVFSTPSASGYSPLSSCRLPSSRISLPTH